MAISRLYTFVDGVVPTAAQINGEFNNILNNPIALWSPAASAINFNGQVLTWDALGVTTVSSSASQAWQFTPGSKTGTPGATGSVQNWVASTFTDNNTGPSQTTALFAAHALQRPTLAATNTSVTTTDAATLYIAGSPTAGTNETITNAWSLLAGSNIKLLGTANNVGTIATGTWNGTPIGTPYGGTNINSSALTGLPYLSSAGAWSINTSQSVQLQWLGVGGAPTTNAPIRLYGSVSGSSVLQAQSAAGATTFTLPTTSGTLIGSGDTSTVTSSMLAGSIPASKLVGTDIATVGTITTGTWQGTPVGATYGGTGQNSSAWSGVPVVAAGTWGSFSAAQVPGTHNLGLAVSVSANALTVALKGANGSDPSATNPVTILVRNDTLTTGTPVTQIVTAALSATVPSTATLGTTNGVTYRLYIGYQFDTAHALVLFNTQGSGLLYPLPNEGQIYTPTILNASSNSAGVLYSGSSPSGLARGVKWLGYIEVSEATAGTWASAPTAIAVLAPTVPRSGAVIQSVFTTTSTITANATSTYADTTLTATITPTNVINRIKTTVFQNGIHEQTNGGSGVLLKLVAGGSDLALIGSGLAQGNGTINPRITAGIVYVDAPATTSARIYKTQFAHGSNNDGATVQDASAVSTILLEEIFP